MVTEKTGKVLAVNISKHKGEKKKNIGEAFFKENWGIEIDAHAGIGHRQISLLSSYSVDKMKKLGAEVAFGDFAENITLDGIDVSKLPVGTRIKIADTLLEVTQIGKECTNKGCAIKKQVGICVMPKEGIFAQVINSGTIKVGDTIEVIN
ncbi:MAG: MOSC domain-containing protein [Syntrophomonadaceae bacterium]|nr:MOSC domain-containing protein [Syntrophomonadaceae bacterium]